MGTSPVRLSLAAIGLSVLLTSGARAREIPARLGDPAFWEIVTGLSEESGRFPGQYMSNEDSALVVIPELRRRTAPGGVYIGVGSEQNFTYIAATRPRLAFIVDIRRENMLQHLLYKALFELSGDRADFVSRVFSRPRPPGLETETDVRTLFARYAETGTDASLIAQNTAEAIDLLVGGHGFPLTGEDQAAIRRIGEAMAAAGPDTLQGMGDPTNPSYARLMAATDLEGGLESYLASEENFRIVKDLESRNLVVPLVGDFAGDRAIEGIGDYLRERDAVADVFYVSNVERYLFDQGEPGMRFYRNVESLPLSGSALFIRSVTSDISYRLGIPIPDQPTKWRTFLFSIDDCLGDFAAGRIGNYRELFDLGFADRVNR